MKSKTCIPWHSHSGGQPGQQVTSRLNCFGAGKVGSKMIGIKTSENEVKQGTLQVFIRKKTDYRRTPTPENRTFDHGSHW